MKIDKKRLTDLLSLGQFDKARQLIREYYDHQNKTLLNQIILTKFTETTEFKGVENAKLEKLIDSGTVNIGLAKKSNLIWFIVFLLGTVLFSFIYYSNPKAIIIVSVIGGICILGLLITGYNLLEGSYKLVITPQTLTYNYTFKSQIDVPEILTTYIYEDFDNINKDVRLIIYKINSADPEEWSLYDLEYSSNDIGHLIQRIKSKSSK